MVVDFSSQAKIWGERGGGGGRRINPRLHISGELPVHQFLSLGKDQSTVAQRAEATMDEHATRVITLQDIEAHMWLRLQTPTNQQSQSYDPISCHGNSVKRTDEIAYRRRHRDIL